MAIKARNYQCGIKVGSYFGNGIDMTERFPSPRTFLDDIFTLERYNRGEPKSLVFINAFTEVELGVWIAYFREPTDEGYSVGRYFYHFVHAGPEHFSNNPEWMDMQRMVESFLQKYPEADRTISLKLPRRP